MSFSKDTPPAHGQGTRADMHCHSTASQVSKLGVQRALGLPECATPPEEVYALAKRRGMDFVTITDHDTIAGALEIAELAGVFISEELTAGFRGEAQAVHVLCWGITGEDHEWLQAHRGDVELCAGYLHEREIACALAHPYYTVAAPLRSRHLRRLAELFAVWEVRNGARAPELNRPAATYVATRGAIGVGGSDDHAGVDIGRTFTEAPAAASASEFLEHVRAGRVLPRGAQGSAAKWAHAAIAIAVRSLSFGAPSDGGSRVDPMRVHEMATRLLREGDARRGSASGDLDPDDARCLLRAWRSALELEELDERALLACMQEEGFSHSALYRRACRIHERRLRDAVTGALELANGEVDTGRAARGLFEACIPVIPYAPATAFLGREHAKLAAIGGHEAALVAGASGNGGAEDAAVVRVAILADGIGSTHGVSRTIEEIRQRGVPGFEIEIVGTDARVDRRLAAVAEVEVPFYPGLHVGVPSVPAAVHALSDGGFDAIHVCTPGPAGVAGALIARALAVPLLGSYHTELTTYADLRSRQPHVTAAVALAMSTFYGACDVVLSPTPAADEALAAIGVAGERILRWDRGVDAARFAPAAAARRARRETPATGDEPLNALYAGRITREKGLDLLAEAFLLAREREPRLHLLLAGGGPERSRLEERLGAHATFLGWLEDDELAAAYARADIFLFPSATDTFGQVILEAQASGVPVLAVDRGGPVSLIEHRVSGLLCPPEPVAMAEALVELARTPLLRERLATAGLAAAGARTWERALELLASGYREMLRRAAGRGQTRAAA